MRRPTSASCHQELTNLAKPNAIFTDFCKLLADDTTERVAAFLSWRDLSSVTLCCRATSSIHELASFRSLRFLEASADSNRQVWSLPTGLHGLEELKLANTSADTIGSVTGFISDFSKLRSLDLTSGQRHMPCPLPLHLPALQELKLARLDFGTIGFVKRYVNVRVLELSDYEGILNLAFARDLLSLEVLTVPVVRSSAVEDLVAIAPRLVSFACDGVDSVWSRTGDPVMAERLARAFVRLEVLTISHQVPSALPSVGLISGLRELTLGWSDTSDISALCQLDLEWDPPSNITPLAALPRLRSLKCYSKASYEGPAVEPASSRHLEEFSGTASCLQLMKDLDQLTHLRVKNRNEFKPPRMQRLHKLEIQGKASMRDFHVLSPRELTLGWYSTVTPELLHEVSQCHELESFVCESWDSSIDLRHISLPQLRVLQVRNLQTLDGIEGFPNLRELHVLVGSQAEEIDWSPLESLSRLRDLTISSLTKDPTPLTRMPSLERVTLPTGVDSNPVVYAYHASRRKYPDAVPSDLRQMHVDHKGFLWSTRFHVQPKLHTVKTAREVSGPSPAGAQPGSK